METQQKEKLQKLLGSWEGVTKTWFEPGKPAIEETNRGTFKAGVNENFVIYEYESVMEGNSFRGMAMYGYYSEKEKFQSSWVDGFHMSGAIMFSEGASTEKGFSVLGSYVYENISWGWRTEIEIIATDAIKITAYNISPEGKEDKAIETAYTRIK